MITRLEKIEEDQSVEYIGDVYVTGNIGKNAHIKIKDGSLLVQGHIGAEVHITLIKESAPSLLSSTSLFTPPSDVSIHISGSVAEKVIIKALRANITVNGALGYESKICVHHGTICVTNIGKDVLLQTHHGDINCRDVDDDTAVKTHIGSIHARSMGKRSLALTHQGDINVDSAMPSVQLTSYTGSVYMRGNKLKDREESLWSKRARLPLVSLTSWEY